MFGENKINEFLETLASNSPVPGGGSVAALSAAISSSLVAMVASLTAGKKGYEEHELEMKGIMEIMDKFRVKFTEDIDKDASSFDGVMQAMKLPKATDEEKEIRKNKIQEETKKAAMVPLEVAKDAIKIMDFALIVAEKGNKNALSDAMVAAMMSRTAVLGALYNVKINLGGIKDEKFVAEISAEVTELEKKAVEMEAKVLSKFQ